MPATDFQGSSPFSSFGRSLLSLRRDTPAASPAMPPPVASAEDAELEAFQRHVAVLLSDLRAGDGCGEEFLSAAWIRRLLEAFLMCQEEFRVVAAAQARRRGGAAPAAAAGLQAEKAVAEFGERAVKALDVCNAARDGVDQVRRWERLAGIAASALQPASGEIHEGQLRRARKALSDLAALLVDDAAAAAAAGGAGGVASFLASHRNRSFGRARASPSRAASLASSSSSSSSHFRSLSWSVSRTWSAARQLQAIGAGLAAPRAHEAGGLAAPAYAMGCLLHLAAWALVAAVPCPDRAAALQGHHLPAAPPRAAFPWAPPLVALQERLAEEGKRKDRRNSCGLLREIHALEKSAQRLAEAIDAAPVPLAGDREAEVREAAAELAAACAAMRDGLEPLERQVREVFHRIVRGRMEGLDSPAINAG
ncbi:hypothetical protein ACP4OV_014590 [Aristida adscensionis]